MNILVLAISLYQRSRLVNRAVRLAVAAHHMIRKPVTRPCPHAAEGCSSHFAAQARTARFGGLAALPSILAAMSLCGPGTYKVQCPGQVDESTHCRPASSAGIDSMEWCIRASTGDCWTSKPSPVSCPSDCLGVMGSPSGGGWC